MKETSPPGKRRKLGKNLSSRKIPLSQVLDDAPNPVRLQVLVKNFSDRTKLGLSEPFAKSPQRWLLVTDPKGKKTGLASYKVRRAEVVRLHDGQLNFEALSFLPARDDDGENEDNEDNEEIELSDELAAKLSSSIKLMGDAADDAIFQIDKALEKIRSTRSKIAKLKPTNTKSES